MYQSRPVRSLAPRNLHRAWLSRTGGHRSDPGLGAERGEALRLAVLILLEKLTPAERAAYILREAFDYSYRQIANILQMEEANTRQLVSRARKHIADGRRTRQFGEQRRLLEAFIAAAQKGKWPLWKVSSLRVLSLMRVELGPLARMIPVSGRSRVATVNYRHVTCSR